MSQTLTITAEQVLASAERIREDIVRDRRTLHAAPEVGTDLPNTVAYLCNAIGTAELSGIPVRNHPSVQNDAGCLCLRQ